jgi:hypothetical protein
MDAVLREMKQLHGVALSSEAGEALESAGSLDADTLCAVTSVSAIQLCKIGDLLAAGALERWYLVTEEQAFYVSERPSERRRLVAVGEAVKTPEGTSKGLHKAAR